MTSATEETVDLLVVSTEALIALERYDDAFAMLIKAQAMAESLNYVRGTLLIRFTIGSIRFKQGRYLEAKQDFLSVWKEAQLVGADKLAQNASSNLGSTCIMLADFEQALDIFDSLLSKATRRTPALYAHLLTQRGFIKQRAKDHPGALNDLLLAIHIRDSIGDVTGQVKPLQHASNSHWSLGSKATAISTLKRSLELASHAQLHQAVLEIHHKLHQWYSETQDFEKALEHLRSRSTMSDSLNRSRFDESVALGEVLYETASKEHRIAQQDQALALAATENRRRSFQRNALIGATILLALIALLLFRSMRNRQRLASKEKELHHERIDQLLSQQEIKSINAMLEGQEKERDRMAKDLHDRLGSMLGGIKANMSALEDRVEQMRQDQQYQKVNRLLDQTVSELRQISHDMAAATLSRFGLEKALKDLRDTIHINGRLAVELKIFGLDQRLERSVELAVYRIVQELVSNVLKHAQARELSIDVTRTPGRLSVVVADDGAGFNTTSHSDGMGLTNVRSRASAIGATAQVDSTPGKGTTVSVECPVVE